MAKKPRNYRSEYDHYQGQPEQIKRRDERNAARAKLKKAGVNVAGKDVDHAKPIVKGGGNNKGNLRVRSVHANRSFPRTPGAGMK